MSELSEARFELLYFFCRLQAPGIALSAEVCRRHLERTYGLFQAKQPVPLDAYLDNLYPVDWFIACACIEGETAAWEQLFASRAGRSDCLLPDALRARASRLYPRDEEKQESAVEEFWGQLCVAPAPNSIPVLARYDGQRPLIPWLIRVFQNWHISQLRRSHLTQSLPDDDFALPLPANPDDGRWRQEFTHAVAEWLDGLKDPELLLLGLRLRYRLSQREVAKTLKVHEGTISRRSDQIRDECLAFVSQRLQEQGWTGDDLFDFVRTEMYSLLLDSPRLSADELARLLAQQGKTMQVNQRN